MKDQEGECHGSGHLEYDDGSFLTGAWVHGVREGHFRLDTALPACHVLHLEGDYKGDQLRGRARVQLRDLGEMTKNPLIGLATQPALR